MKLLKTRMVVAIRAMLELDSAYGAASSKAVAIADMAQSTMVKAATDSITFVGSLEGSEKERATTHHQSILKAVNVILGEKGQHLTAALNAKDGKAVFNSEYVPKAPAKPKAKTSQKVQLKLEKEKARNARGAADIATKSEAKVKRELKSKITAFDKITNELALANAILDQIGKTAAGKKSIAAAKKVIKAAA